MKGYADRQIAHLLRCLESEVHKKRTEMGIKRVYKLVDTCAAEFEAKTPYYYSTFELDKEIDGKRMSENESVVSDRKKKIVVLGSVLTELDGALSLTIVVCMVYLQLKNAITKLS